MATEIMVGKFFHSYESGSIQWQGRVLIERGDYFLVQLYSFLDGYPTDQIFVSLKDMLSWKFYNTEEEWLEAYQKRHPPAVPIPLSGD